MTVDSPVYGTDVMVGVATDKAPLATGQRSYCSLLGRETESWGWSYQGYTQVANDSYYYYIISGKKDNWHCIGFHHQFPAWWSTAEVWIQVGSGGQIGCSFRRLERHPRVLSQQKTPRRCLHQPQKQNCVPCDMLYCSQVFHDTDHSPILAFIS